MQLTGNGAAQCQHIAKRVENGRDKAEENKTAPMRYGEIIEGQINAGEIENLQRDKGTKTARLNRHHIARRILADPVKQAIHQ